MQELMLKDQEKSTDFDKQSLEYIKNILGEDMYNTVKEAIINNSKINISKDPLKDLPMYTICSLYKDGDRVQLCAPSGQYFAATVTLSNNIPEIKFDDQDGYAAACRGQYASVQDGLSEIAQAGIKSGNSFKEIGSDFYSGLKNRGDKAFDSPSDFLNWATLGAPDVIKATLQANAERSDKAFSSVYDGINWLSFGSADMVKGTFNPEDPLSKEHWLNSFGTASVIFGGRGATSSLEKTSMIDHIPSNEILNKNSSVKLSEISEAVSEAKFTYKNNPMDNAKAAKDIIGNPDAVYSYSLKPESKLNSFGVDWTNPDEVAYAQSERIRYHEHLEQKKAILKDEMTNLQNDGYSMEDIAIMKVEQRNQDRINNYIKSNNYDGLEAMKQRNLEEYKRAEGPTAEQLYKKNGSWEAVIYSSVRSNPAMDVVTGLYDIYGGD